jgi:hypothetical protein
MHSLRLEFAGLADDDASMAAQSLLTHLREQMTPDDGETLQLERSNPRSLDAGSVLMLLLGTPAALKAIELVGEFIRLKLGWSENAKVVIKTRDGHILVEGSATKQIDLNRALEILSANQPKSE